MIAARLHRESLAALCSVIDRFAQPVVRRPSVPLDMCCGCQHPLDGDNAFLCRSCVAQWPTEETIR